MVGSPDALKYSDCKRFSYGVLDRHTKAGHPGLGDYIAKVPQRVQGKALPLLTEDTQASFLS